MEGDKVYIDSYNNLDKLMKSNTGSKVTINYDDFDNITASEIRKSINEAINIRRKAIMQVIQGAK